MMNHTPIVKGQTQIIEPEPWFTSDDEPNRLPLAACALVWIALSTPLWGGIIALVVWCL